MPIIHHLKSGSLALLLLLAVAACSSDSHADSAATPQPGESATPASTQRQRPSPAATAEVEINGRKIMVGYSRPSMRGRKIMGDLVPWNRVWRTGANEATKFSTDADLMFGSVTVPKGDYTLYTLPSESGWKLIINKQTGQWGTQYDESQDLARIDMNVKQLSSPVEQFTITLEQAAGGGLLKMEWENTSASAGFKLK